VLNLLHVVGGDEPVAAVHTPAQQNLTYKRKFSDQTEILKFKSLNFLFSLFLSWPASE
jgi:hypothetical protein